MRRIGAMLVVLVGCAAKADMRWRLVLTVAPGSKKIDYIVYKP